MPVSMGDASQPAIASPGDPICGAQDILILFMHVPPEARKCGGGFCISEYSFAQFLSDKLPVTS